MSPRIFVSHAWVDQLEQRTVENPRRGLVHLLRDALRDEGVEVFYDNGDIQELDEIEARIERGLKDASVMVSWYSDAYPTRRACQWELMTALTTDAQRVIVVNPEPSLAHILPSSLRAQLIPAVRDEQDEAGWAQLARLIASRARAMGGVFGQLAGSDTAAWYGDPPGRFERFVGRAEAMWELDSLLRPAPAASGGDVPAEVVVVHGLGGLGKTAFAFEYAARFAGAYPGGIFWLRAGGGESETGYEARLTGQLDDQLHGIAAQIDPSFAERDADGGAGRGDNAQRIIRIQLDSSDQPFLWVVDDLPPGLSTTEFRCWLPPSSHGRTVVTSRGTTYRHVSNLSLPLLNPDEAVELLRAAGSSQDALDGGVGEELADRLGYLPLALETVGTLASLPGTSAETLLSELEDPVELADRAAANPFMSASPTEHPLDIATTFGPSLTRLDEASFGLLAAAAALNVGPLPAAIILSVAEHTVGIPAAALPGALGMLLSRSLARNIDRDAFEVHPLLGGAALRWVADRASFSAACRGEAARHVGRTLGDADDISTHGRTRRVAAFAGALLVSMGDFDDVSAELEALRCMGRFLHTEGRYNEAATLERRAVALAIAEFGEDDHDTLAKQVNLAVTLGRLGDSAEARELLERTIPRLERLGQPDDIDLLTAKHNLSIQVYPTDPQEATRLGLEVYDARRRVLGADHPHTLFSLHTLLSQDVLPSGYSDFVAAYEDLIARRTAVLGPDHTTTLTSVNNFIDRLLRLDRAATALPLARKLVERRSELYGPDHIATLGAKTRLLAVLVAVGDPPLDEVRALVADTMSMLRAAGDQPDVPLQMMLIAVGNAAENLRRAGHPGLAAEILTEALPLVVEKRGSTHREVLLIEHNLGAALASQDALDLARQRFDDLVPRMERVLGARDRLTLRARRQQAILAARLDNVDDAIHTQLELASLWRELSGASSPEYAEALSDLAESFELNGRLTEAEHYRALQHATGAGDQLWRARHA